MYLRSWFTAVKKTKNLLHETINIIYRFTTPLGVYVFSIECKIVPLALLWLTAGHCQCLMILHHTDQIPKTNILKMTNFAYIWSEKLTRNIVSMLSDQNGHLVGRIHGLYIFLPQKTQRWKENIQLSPIGSSVSVPQNSSNGYLNVVFALSKAWMCLFITSFPYKDNLQKEVHLYNLGATR